MVEKRWSPTLDFDVVPSSIVTSFIVVHCWRLSKWRRKQNGKKGLVLWCHVVLVEGHISQEFIVCLGHSKFWRLLNQFYSTSICLCRAASLGSFKWFHGNFFKFEKLSWIYFGLSIYFEYCFPSVSMLHVWLLKINSERLRWMLRNLKILIPSQYIHSFYQPSTFNGGWIYPGSVVMVTTWFVFWDFSETFALLSSREMLFSGYRWQETDTRECNISPSDVI